MYTEFLLAKYGFVMLMKTPQGIKTVTLQEHKEELEKYKDPKYLQSQIDNIDRMIELDNLTK